MAALSGGPTRLGGGGMAEQDDVEEQFRSLMAEFDPAPPEPLPRPSRSSLREVKREAKRRKKAAAMPPRPVEPHRAYLAEPRTAPRRPHSERTRAIAIGVTVLAIMAGIIWFQWFRSPSLTPAADPAGSSSTSRPTPGVDEAEAPLGTPPHIEDQPGRYAFVDTQAGSSAAVAYDPCRPVRYVVRTAHSPRQASRLIADAMATLSSATGLRFVAAGRTDEIPTGDRAPFQPSRYGDRWAPVLIGWATAQENPTLADGVIGVAGSTPDGVPGGPTIFVTGDAAFSAEWFQQQLRTAKGYTEAEAVVLHELGHVLGLGHVPDRSQIMFEMERPQVTKYGVGDLAGLARLGGGACEPRL
jgi:hypothetical protein